MPVPRGPKRLGLAHALDPAENGLILIHVGAVRAPGADHEAAEVGIDLVDGHVDGMPDTIEVVAIT
ncbi:MAG: hypothetical protein ABSH35_15485 [Isosphaeraceae bacterium]